MEPFFLRCETCQARLRVRDEQFLGQVQSCPKCGSMVQIIAPAGWLAMGEAAPTPQMTEVAAAQTPTIVARVVGTMRDHASIWIAGTATAVVACGLLGFLAFRGSDEAATLPPHTPIVATPVTEPSEDEELPAQTPLTEAVAESEPVAAAPLATISAPPSTSEKTARIEVPALPVVAPSAVARELVAIAEKPRTLTLEPVHESATAMSANTNATAIPAYPPAVEVESTVAAAKPPLGREVEADPQAAAAAASARITNFKDQLALPIDSIDLPTMPIGEFVNLVSSMAAVPIKLDAKVLGDVGLSSRSTVTVRGDNTTVGKLLAGVLKEHQLTCVERDGMLVVVQAKRQ